jgi:hypothetical protein
MLRFGTIRIHSVKEIFDTTTIEGQDHFKTRTATLLAAKQEIREGAIGTEAARYVISVKPGYTYMVVSGLHGDVTNENGDLFPWTELLKKKDNGKFMFESWIGCPVLLNHDMSKRVGTIIDAIPIREEKSIDFLLEVEDKLAPHVAQGIKRGDITGTSMGVLVGQSQCSICGNIAFEEKDWCRELSPTGLNLKGRIYLGQDGGKYREKMGQRVEEINMSLEGVEDSLITFGEPADPEALIKKVLAKKEEENMGVRPDEFQNPRGGKGTLRSVDDKRIQGAPEGGAMPVINPKDIAAQVKMTAQYKEVAGDPDDSRSAAGPKFTDATQVLADIKAGKLSKASAVEAVDTLRLATARQLEDMTPKQAIALLEEEAGLEDDTEMKVQAQAEAPAVVGDSAKNPEKKTPAGNQQKEVKPNHEDEPKPKAEKITEGTPNGTQSAEVKDKEEDQPSPEGSLKTPKGEAGNQAADTNKSKVEAIMKQMAELNKMVAQLKNSDIPASPCGTQAGEVNAAKPQDVKPAPKKVEINSGTPNGTQSCETNGKKPEDGQPKPKTAGKSVKAEEEEKDESKESEEKPFEKKEEAPESHESSETPAVENLEESVVAEGDPLDKVLDLVNQIKSVIEETTGVEGDTCGDVAAMPPVEDVGIAGVMAAPVPPVAPIGGAMETLYAAKLIKDEKSPIDSYYTVSHKNKPVFAISCRQAFQELADKNVDSFLSDDYKAALEGELKANGAKKVYKDMYQSMGMVTAQLEGAPQAQAPAAVGAEALPEETEPQAGPAAVEGDALADMTTDDPQTSELSTNLLDFLTVYIGADETADTRQVLDELVKVVAGEGSVLNENFAGKVDKAVADKKTEEAVDGVPDVYKDDVAADAVAPAPELPSKPSEMISALKKANAKLALVKKNLPVITAEVAKLQAEIVAKDAVIEKYEYETYIKARQTVTSKIAKQKAELGLIKAEDVRGEAVRLAKLQDVEFKNEIEVLENSVKIANKLSEKQDYKKVEGQGTPRFASVVPSPYDSKAEVVEENDGLMFSKAEGR